MSLQHNCYRRATSQTLPSNPSAVIQMRYELAIVVACESPIALAGFDIRTTVRPTPPGGRRLMRVLIATDAWHPQVNGVVRTLTSLAASARTLGVAVEFLTPEGFPSFALPTYSNLRLALPNRREIARRIQAAAPDAIHIATEGHDRRFRARLLPAPRLAVHDELHDAVSGIHLGALPDPGILELRGAAALPFRGDRDHGLDRVADVGAAAARLPESRDVDARRRHRPVCAASRDSSGSAASDLPDRRPRRGREKSRSVPVARSARLQGGDRRRTAGSRAASAASRRRRFSDCAAARSSPA